MEINHEKVVRFCKQRGFSLGQALKAAGVSSNAYYTLARKESVIPKSLMALADALGVAPSELLFDRALLTKQHEELMAEVDEVVALTGDADRDLIRHTLILLREDPIDRLSRGLELGRIKHS